jgi:hypothetical protein
MRSMPAPRSAGVIIDQAKQPVQGTALGSLGEAAYDGPNDQVSRAAVVPLPAACRERREGRSRPRTAPKPAPWQTQPLRRRNSLEDSVWGGVDRDPEFTEALNGSAYVYRLGRWRPPPD